MRSERGAPAAEARAYSDRGQRHSGRGQAAALAKFPGLEPKAQHPQVTDWGQVLAEVRPEVVEAEAQPVEELRAVGVVVRQAQRPEPLHCPLQYAPQPS